MFVNMGFIRLMYVIVLLVATLILMVVTDWKLALLSWLFIPPTALIAIRMTSQAPADLDAGAEPPGRTRRRAAGEPQRHARRQGVRPRGLREPKVQRAGAEPLQELVRHQPHPGDVLADPQRRRGRSRWSPPPGSAPTRSSTAISPPATLAKFMLYLTMLQLPVRSLGFITLLWARAATSGERIYDILDAESAVQESPDAVNCKNVTGHVRFEDVSFGYDAISPVLASRQPRGEARRSRRAARTDRQRQDDRRQPDAALLRRHRRRDHHRRRRHPRRQRSPRCAAPSASCSRTSSSSRPRSARTSPTARRSATDEDVERVAKLARIHDFIVTLPDGYDTWVGERGITLSGGQKQRISIARTLLLDPKILVFDDSTSSVDTETEYLIQQALAELMKGRTTFVIAQRLRTVKTGRPDPRAAGGNIVEHGRHDELIKRRRSLPRDLRPRAARPGRGLRAREGASGRRRQ